MYAYDWILANYICVWDLVGGWVYVRGVLVDDLSSPWELERLDLQDESSASGSFLLCLFPPSSRE
jgi:hypothetical protein